MLVALKKVLKTILLLLSVLGLCVSVFFHVAGWFDYQTRDQIGGVTMWTLHVGVFVVMFPVIFAFGWNRKLERWRQWPRWWIRTLYVVFAYGGIFTCILLIQAHWTNLTRGELRDATLSPWGYTGVWMLFYLLSVSCYVVLFKSGHTGGDTETETTC